MFSQILTWEKKLSFTLNLVMYFRKHSLLKNAVFWDIITQFVPHRRHYLSVTDPSRLMLRMI
jgi:hypothetical protein